MQNQRGSPFEFPASELLSKREIGVEEIDRQPVGSERISKQIESSTLAFILLKNFVFCDSSCAAILPVPFQLLLVLDSVFPSTNTSTAIAEYDCDCEYKAAECKQDTAVSSSPSKRSLAIGCLVLEILFERSMAGEVKAKGGGSVIGGVPRSRSGNH